MPKSESFSSGADVTREVAECHIFRESKMFVGQFETLNGRTVVVEGNKVSTKEGWKEAREVRILFEELFYNRLWQKFRVVCTDGALIGGRPPGAPSVPQMPALAHRTLQNSKIYLEAFPENEFVLRKIRQYCDTFVSTYYIVKGFEHHARDKVKALVQKSVDDLLCTNKTFRQYHYEDRNMDALSQVVGNYMFEHLHGKLFASMCEIHRDQDENLVELAEASCSVLSLAQMGSGEAFAAQDLPLAVATLSGIEERRTPLEKLLCLKETMDAINEDLLAFREKQTDRLRSNMASSRESLVTADELLPLLVFVLVRAKLTHFSASLAYAEYFTFFNAQTSELGFCLTTYKAALQLMLESRILRKNRRAKFPDSKHAEKKGRKSVSARRSTTTTGGQPGDMMKRTISVPAGMTTDAMRDDAKARELQEKYLGISRGTNE